MIKPLFLSFILFFSAAAAGASFHSNLVKHESQPHPGSSYDNRWSRKEISTNWPRDLTLIFPKKKAVIKQEQLQNWQEGTADFAPASYSSLGQYFFAEVGTAHPWTNYAASAKVKGLGLSEKVLGRHLQKVSGEENRPPRDAKLVIENGRATQFVPDEDGQTFDAAGARLVLATGLAAGKNEITLPINTTTPAVRLKDLNNLGIKDLLVRGQSDFSGSSAYRIHNIRVGASRYNGLIIKPGEEFSFNKYLGPVDAEAGFLPELVIKPEGTVPELGGGLCQVSSTAFRAAFFGGLPITARRNHSYAVKYYEWIADDQPRAVGLDATIYPGAQDMKFLNDTSGAVLIATKVEGKRLYFDFYGTRDDRQVTVDGPHPYDRQPSGAVKSKVSRTVTKDGKENTVTFESRYVSPLLYPKIYEYPKVQP